MTGQPWRDITDDVGDGPEPDPDVAGGLRAQLAEVLADLGRTTARAAVEAAKASILEVVDERARSRNLADLEGFLAGFGFPPVPTTDAQDAHHDLEVRYEALLDVLAAIWVLDPEPRNPQVGLTVPTESPAQARANALLLVRDVISNSDLSAHERARIQRIPL